MDFIERWFGVFPDGGNGSLEALYLVTILGGIVAAGLYRRLRVIPTRVAMVAQPTRADDRGRN